MQLLKMLYSRKNSLPVRLTALALTLICAVTLLSQAVFAKTTYVITDGNEVLVHTTYATDPAKVLNEAGFSLNEADTYETQPGLGVEEITVIRSQSVTIHYCGETMEVTTYGETVQSLLDRLGIVLGEDATISVSPEIETYDGMVLLISRTVVSTDGYTAVIPYETVYEYTDALPEGTEVVLTQGVDGQMRVTAKVIYVNGRETVRSVESREVITEPVTQVIAKGTGNGSQNGQTIIGDGIIVTAAGDVLTYTHRETFTATAYCREEVGGQITAVGTVTRVGAIAVDPRVIPYGTRLFIVTQDGQYIYGVAVAEDCGSSIKGYRLDLFYESMAECVEFGIRDCDVYFLG